MYLYLNDRRRKARTLPNFAGFVSFALEILSPSCVIQRGIRIPIPSVAFCTICRFDTSPRNVRSRDGPRERSVPFPGSPSLSDKFESLVALASFSHEFKKRHPRRHLAWKSSAWLDGLSGRLNKIIMIRPRLISAGGTPVVAGRRVSQPLR